MISSLIFSSSANDNLQKSMSEALSDKNGVCVFIDCESGNMFTTDSAASGERHTPCSTFKIWNSLIGMETGLVSSADEAFYKWDGEKRSYEAWNKDLNFRQAFQVSCVPAFQSLARKIGPERMKFWIDTIGYGDKDISSGTDEFWLPREGKKSILISPGEQAELVKSLVNGHLPFSSAARKTLQELMQAEKTERGILYGKTGSGVNGGLDQDIGWYVGYVVNENATYSFACLLKGKGVFGSNAKKVIEAILIKNKML